MGTSFDMSKFNTFIQQASDSIMCNSDCQKQKEIEKLKQKYDNSQVNLASASNQVQVAQRNYVTYAQGESVYNDLQDKELYDKATLITDTFKTNFDDESAKIQTQINSYESLYVNYDNVQELYLKYEKENADLFKELKKTSNDVLTNERKTYYEDQGISSLNTYYSILISIYIFVLVVFLLSIFLVKTNISFMVRIFILFLMIIYPFVCYGLFHLLYNLYNNIKGIFPSNAYRTL